MSLVHLCFESQYLGNNTDVNIILPDKPRAISPADFYGSGRKYRVLWLLHGTYGDYTDWLRKSSIELYACERDLVVVMPSGLNAMYENWPNFCLGYQCFDYLFDELMPLVYNWFPVSQAREDNFIAGLSMGGRGTLRSMLAHPEKFAGAASMSFVPVDYASEPEAARLQRIAESPRAQLQAFAGAGGQPGNDFPDGMRSLRQRNDMDKWGGMKAFLASGENLWPDFRDFAALKEPPKLFMCCGTDDPLFYTTGDYGRFLAYLDTLGVNYGHAEGAGGHEWRVWERDIQRVLDFFGIRNEALGNAF